MERRKKRGLIVAVVIGVIGLILVLKKIEVKYELPSTLEEKKFEFSDYEVTVRSVPVVGYTRRHFDKFEEFCTFGEMDYVDPSVSFSSKTSGELKTYSFNPKKMGAHLAIYTIYSEKRVVLQFQYADRAGRCGATETKTLVYFDQQANLIRPDQVFENVFGEVEVDLNGDRLSPPLQVPREVDIWFGGHEHYGGREADLYAEKINSSEVRVYIYDLTETKLAPWFNNGQALTLTSKKWEEYQDKDYGDRGKFLQNYID